MCSRSSSLASRSWKACIRSRAGRRTMLHMPILRHGNPYESIDKVEIVHHATGEPVARVSQANSGLISRDVNRMDHDVLEQFKVRELIDMCRKAAEVFIGETVPL